MYKSVKYLTKITGEIFTTHYFYERETRVLLPVETAPFRHRSAPGISDTITRIIKGLGSTLVGIKVFLYSNGKYYTYLSVASGKEILDFHIGTSDAIEIAKNINIPIYVEETILKNEGIKVTKKLLDEALTDEFIKISR